MTIQSLRKGHRKTRNDLRPVSIEQLALDCLHAQAAGRAFYSDRSECLVSPANNLPKPDVGAIPEAIIVDAPTAPLSFDDPTVPGEAFEDVDLSGVDQ